MEDNTQKEEIVEQPSAPVTEVTSIVKEEEKTGQKINLPSPEELIARASSNVIANLQMWKRLTGAKNGSSYVISRKGMNRITEAIFDLPSEGQKVMLQGNEEKQAFFIGQNMVRSLFLLMQNHINEEIRKRKDAEALKVEENKPKEGETNEPRTE